MKLDELLQGIWDMNEPCTRDEDLFIFDRMTLGEYIIKHVVINDDMSYKDMLLDILQIKYNIKRHICRIFAFLLQMILEAVSKKYTFYCI